MKNNKNILKRIPIFWSTFKPPTKWNTLQDLKNVILKIQKSLIKPKTIVIFCFATTIM